MKNNIAELKNIINSYQPINEQEEKDKDYMLWYLKCFGEKALYRECLSGHFTTSVFLFNKNHTKAFMCYHLIDQSWAWLGGHADGIADLKSVAIREIGEESSITNFKLINDEKVSALTCIAIPGYVKNGEYVSSHIHLDVAFVGEADEDEKFEILPSENSGLKWINLNVLDKEVSDTWKMKRTYEKIIQQFKQVSKKESRQ